MIVVCVKVVYLIYQLTTKTKQMKTLKQIISELQELQNKYGEDTLVTTTTCDSFSWYGKEVEQDFSTHFNGDFLVITHKLKEYEGKQAKITFRK